MKFEVKRLVNIRNSIVIILSLILSLFMMIGLSFDMYKSLGLVLKHPVISIFLYIFLVILFRFIIDYFFEKLDLFKEKKYDKDNKFLKLFDRHPFIFSLCFIVICWLVYVIAFYPTILTPDSSNQILQFFGIDNYYSHVSNLIDESVIITNHHPVVHTLFIGFCVNIGKLIGNVNFGLFLVSLFQIVIMSCTFSYGIKFLKEINVGLKFRFACLLIFAFVPVFPLYAMTCVKDSIFGPLFILYVIMLARVVILKASVSISYIFKIIFVMLMLILIRNNGIHIILLSFPFLFLIKYDVLKDKLKLICVFVFILLFNFSYNKVVLPYFKITPSSVREKLSIPFQQTARYVKKYKDEITEEEKNNIDVILNYNTLGDRYDPEISDPVKNKFNKDSTDEDLSNYFSTWFKQFKKHPVVYFEATLHNTYGYYYPYKTNWYFYYKFKDKITKHDFDYHYNGLDNLRSGLVLLGHVFPYIPLVGLLINIGFGTWVLLFMIGYLIYRKKYRELVLFIPSVVSFMVCIASPVNVYFRYALPNVFVMPFLVLMFLSIIQNKEGERNEKK